MEDDGTRKIKYEGVVRKCPNCGDPIDAFEFICDKCGYNFSSGKMSTSKERLEAQLKELDSQLQQLENEMRNKRLESNSAAARTKSVEEKTALYTQVINLRSAKLECKENKAKCINTFSVDNNIEEIVSFMLYASGNIDMKCLATSTSSSAYDKGDHQIAEAWVNKMEQMYNIAQLSFSNSPLFSKVESIYREKKEEIKKTKKKSFLTNKNIWIFSLVGIFMVFIMINAAQRMKTESDTIASMKAAGYVQVKSNVDYKNKNYKLVQKQFEDLGFTNIELIELNDAFSFLGSSDKGEVESVSINGETRFNDGAYFDPKSRVVITYH